MKKTHMFATAHRMKYYSTIGRPLGKRGEIHQFDTSAAPVCQTQRMDMQVRMKFVLRLIIITGLFLFPLIVGADSQDTSFAQKRKQMVESQIKLRGIKDLRVLNAILKVKRHLFVPSNIRHLAYEDFPLSIGGGQTISQPYIVALMTELLELKGTERILEIGTGSGYQAAILAELVKEVYTIEILEPLARKSEGLLKVRSVVNSGHQTFHAASRFS
jgi:hypothetical protein